MVTLSSPKDCSLEKEPTKAYTSYTMIRFIERKGAESMDSRLSYLNFSFLYSIFHINVIAEKGLQHHETL